MKRTLKIEQLELRLTLDGGFASEIDRLRAMVEMLKTEAAPSDGWTSTDVQTISGFLEDFIAKKSELFNSLGGTVDLSPPATARGTPSVEVQLESRGRVGAAGDQFMIDLFVMDSFTDLETGQFQFDRRGLFQAKFDLQFDPAVVAPIVDQVQLHEKLSGNIGVITVDNGRLLNVGGTNVVSSLADPSDFVDGRMRIASIPFQAVGTGDAKIAANLTSDGESILIVGHDNPLPASRIAIAPLQFVIDFPNPDLPLPVVDEAFSGGQMFFSHRHSPFLFQPATWLPVWFHDHAYLETTGRWIAVRQVTESRSIAKLEFMRDPSDVEPAVPAVGETQQESQSAEEVPLLAEDSDEVDGLFWRDFDLSLLDDEAAVSRFKLNFRSLRLRLGKECSSAESETSDGRQRTEKPPSVIDMGFADVSSWLSDPAYRSGNPGQQSNRAINAVNADVAITDLPAANGNWQPRGKMANLSRLEVAGELGEEAIAVQFERFGRSDSAIADAQTSVPEN
ncbi:hypothetical protein NHH03_05305 [Stieleria sp. TO1_6]|uniref:hypothetical protein n=1 Tax=Stieleria tagensis TaxID=2956795 RepID=UPI00209A6CF7|nr:hypothetical protein [Stieleria tagensis]MCO8121145.1 hypothetical protein [Stieleria tagensis]